MGCVAHPSGLSSESEIAYISMDYWAHPDNASLAKTADGTWTEPGVWERLLAFQQGWKACKDFNRANNE